MAASRLPRSGVSRLVLLGTAAALLSGCIGRPAEDATGQEIYLQLCSNCHNEDLSGNIGPALGPGSNAADRPDEFLLITIVDGRGRMPSFSSTLNDEQVARLIAYLREKEAR